MRAYISLIFIMFLNSISLGSCNSSNKTADANDARQDTIAQIADFNADSAYAFVKAQCDFGPRVPNTEAHRKAGEYLAAKLKQYGANVIDQTPTLTAFDGTKINARNIIGEFNPAAKQRILLLAHWDCRPWADNDSDPKNISKPVMGANDGASGVGVLLEVARVISLKKPNIGVDILLVDAEDWGSSNNEDSWALGTQHWAKDPHRQGYKPIYGILLDMVGATGAQFTQEYFSCQNAQAVVNEVWNVARLSGYSDYFKESAGGAITDDHVFVNKAGIPTIDIIDMRLSSGTGFFEGWHTTHDTIDVIDPATLKAVGQTLVNLIFKY